MFSVLNLETLCD